MSQMKIVRTAEDLIYESKISNHHGGTGGRKFCAKTGSID